MWFSLGSYAIAGHSRWLIFYLDVIIPFLNSKTQEKVFIELLQGFGEVRLEGLVSLLDIALCGANQSPHCWHENKEMTIYDLRDLRHPKPITDSILPEMTGWLICYFCCICWWHISNRWPHQKNQLNRGKHSSQDARFECHLPFIRMSRILLHQGRHHHDMGDVHNLTSWRMWHGGMQPCKDSHACRFKTYCRHRNSPHQCCKSPTPGGKLTFFNTHETGQF